MLSLQSEEKCHEVTEDLVAASFENNRNLESLLIQGTEEADFKTVLQGSLILINNCFQDLDIKISPNDAF